MSIVGIKPTITKGIGIKKPEIKAADPKVPTDSKDTSKPGTGNTKWNQKADQYDLQLLQEQILEDNYLKDVKKEIEKQKESLLLQSDGKSKKLEDLKESLNAEKASYAKRGSFMNEYENIDKFVKNNEKKVNSESDETGAPTYKEWKENKDRLDELIKNLELLKQIAENTNQRAFD